MYFHKFACGINYPIFTKLLHIYNHIDHIDFENFYGLMVYFTTFCEIFNIFTYSNDWGGGVIKNTDNIHIYTLGGIINKFYVVKTYPSIDPIAAPPPRYRRYKCMVNYWNRLVKMSDIISI